MSEPERTYTTIDKSDWGDGPWQQEPDKVQFRDEVSGFDCLVKRGRTGAWCGYVGLPPGHRFYEVDYDDIPYEAAEVHGGLTYSDHCQEGPEEIAVCHVPAPGEPDNVWWLGFDCGHAGDVRPGMGSRYREITGSFAPFGSEEVYRDLAYVRRETVALAQQLRA